MLATVVEPTAIGAALVLAPVALVLMVALVRGYDVHLHLTRRNGRNGKDH